MKSGEAFYMQRRNMNVRMRQNVCALSDTRFVEAREKESGCEKRESNGIVNAPSLAMVYAPIQMWRDVYDLQTALERGTLFKELDKPLCICEKSVGGGRNGF